MINIAILAIGERPTQRGDDDANFSCEWTDENVKKLVQLLKLRIRRPAPTYAFERGLEAENIPQIYCTHVREIRARMVFMHENRKGAVGVSRTPQKS